MRGRRLPAESARRKVSKNQVSVGTDLARERKSFHETPSHSCRKERKQTTQVSCEPRGEILFTRPFPFKFFLQVSARRRLASQAPCPAQP